nr:protein SHORT HYPOCOTYL IN WHITE LIGHT 1 [Ipomoea batatas]
MAARLSLYPKFHPSPCKPLNPPRFNFQPRIDILPFRIRGTSSTYLQASRRFSTFPQEGDKSVDDSRYRSQRRGGRPGIELGGKISRKARKAVRSVLPVAISSQLVFFYFFAFGSL